MKTVDGEVKLSFWEILFSPVLSLRDMVTSKKDIDDDKELNPDSSNKTEAYLAEHQAKINKRVTAYGGSGKAQRKEMLDSVKVEENELKKNDEKSKGKDDRNRGEYQRERE